MEGLIEIDFEQLSKVIVHDQYIFLIAIDSLHDTLTLRFSLPTDDNYLGKVACTLVFHDVRDFSIDGFAVHELHHLTGRCLELKKDFYAEFHFLDGDNFSKYIKLNFSKCYTDSLIWLEDEYQNPW